MNENIETPKTSPKPPEAPPESTEEESPKIVPDAPPKPKRKRKKILIISGAVAGALIILASAALIVYLSFFAKEKYPYDYIGLYNTESRQVIKMNDKKSRVDTILYRPDEENPAEKASTCIYKDNLKVVYDKRETVRILEFAEYDQHEEKDRSKEIDTLRYELPGGISFGSTVTDFIEKYGYVYTEDKANFADVYVEERDGKMYILKKRDLEKFFNEGKKHGNVFRYTIHFQSYNKIYDFTVERVESLPGKHYLDPMIPIEGSKDK